MNISWITRSFLDYRVPVYEHLYHLLDGKLTLFYYRDVVPKRTRSKTTHVLGQNAIALTGEKRLIGRKLMGDLMANTMVRILYQPGLIKEVSKSKPDIIISDGFYQWTYAALWLRARRNIPHVMCYERTAHTERHAQWFRSTYRKFAMRWIDAISCSGQLCGKYIKSLGFPAENITYGHMVADITGIQNNIVKITNKQLSDLKKEYDLKGTVFIYVGQLVPRKGLIELFKAWKEFKNEIPTDNTLLLVGDGHQMNELRHYAEENHLTDVRFTGFVDYDNLMLYYKVADVFIIPTLEDNWSLVVPEAMACGLPIMCSKYNGCWPELVHPGKNGWVFDSLNHDDTVESLKQCHMAKKKLPEMGKKSIDIVSTHTAKNAAETILKTCKIALNNIRKT